MTRDEIQVGNVYGFKVGKNTTKVRIEAEAGDGWDAKYVASGKPVRIAKPEQLRYEVVAQDEPKAAKAQKGKAADKKTAATAQKKPKKMSCLDAAAKVLADAGTNMTCQEMIEAMSKRHLWSSPNGATPHATLYSAITREIAVKGVEARFAKAERGKFVAAGRC